MSDPVNFPADSNRLEETGGVAPTPGESVPERRRGPDRRKEQIPVAVERRSGRDRREEAAKAAEGQHGERRRMVDPTTCERDYQDEETEFMLAMDQYKRANRRPFPTWSEVLEVVKALGYRKVAAPSAIPGLPVPKSPSPS